MDNAKALRNLFRSQAFDAAEPYLWSDAEVYNYIDRAQRRFCEKVRGIADATTPDITEVMVVAGEMFSPLDPRVLQIRSAYESTTGVNLAPFNSLEAGEAALRQPGSVTGYSLDDQDGYVRWNRVPQADSVVQLSVYRSPLDPISGANDSFEIHSDHHEALLDWVLHLAYLKHDPETYDPARSAEAGLRFDSYCNEARKQLNRKRHAPRPVRYGGY